MPRIPQKFSQKNKKTTNFSHAAFCVLFHCLTNLLNFLRKITSPISTLLR